MMPYTQTDVLIIGSGAAGLGLALSLKQNSAVAILTKEELAHSSSQYAQGGIAAVISEMDSIEEHIQDTLKAGAGLCNREAVEHTVKNARRAIEWLIEQGVQFSTDVNNTLHLTQEGGHSKRRIVHAADKTGAVIINTLAEQVLERPNITCFTQHTAINLLLSEGKCIGASYLNTQKKNAVPEFILAKQVVLATGGASSNYLHTSNPNRNTGDGIAMAWKAGCRVANLEFNQFHPTCLYNPNGQTYLITEAVRGEGGKLILPNGERFMDAYHELAELAPRDIVARAIHNELIKNKIDCVYLDISFEKSQKIKKLFPTIYHHCLQYNIDITKEPIPVVPAAHYTCGGIVVNQYGETDIGNLYAIGETSFTGLHGANRMASNSLLECLVYAATASQKIQEKLNQPINLTFQAPTDFTQNKKTYLDEIESRTFQLRELMWEKVGVFRNNRELNAAFKKIQRLKKETAKLNQSAKLTGKLIELNNMLLSSELMVRCALNRKESRGLHFNSDFPEKNDLAQNTILLPY